ncbi:MAG: hypothetical protein J6S67_22835 [Methanobrevibacter sp.]|nr:hypothetical protein [Methanobrevibacter sp.]
MNKIEAIEYSVDAMGGAYGLANIQTILGIVVLILSIFNVLFNMTYKIIMAVKKRKYEEIKGIVDNSIEELNNVVDDFKELEGEDNENK